MGFSKWKATGDFDSRSVGTEIKCESDGIVQEKIA